MFRFTYGVFGLLLCFGGCRPAAPQDNADSPSSPSVPASQPAPVSYIGDFATEGYPSAYYQKVLISHLEGVGTKVQFTASLINNQPGCSFEADAREIEGHLEMDLPYGGGEATLIITPTETGVRVDTKSEETRPAMMGVCRGSASLLGEYSRIKTRRLTGTFVYFADAALFTDCASGEKYPLALTPGYLELERRYLYLGNKKTMNGIPQPALTELDGYFEDQPDAGSGKSRKHLLVNRIYEMDGEKGCEK